VFRLACRGNAAEAEQHHSARHSGDPRTS